jgi:hypothetical protein
MPNICFNTVSIIGHKEDLDLFEAHKLSFQHFHPRPDDQEDNWYEWNCVNWGTKWEYFPESYTVKGRDTNFLRVTFETAWAPPFKFLEHLLKSYPRCWIKLEFWIEDNDEGVWIAFMKDGKLQEKGLGWQVPEARLTTSGEILIPE